MSSGLVEVGEVVVVVGGEVGTGEIAIAGLGVVVG